MKIIRCFLFVALILLVAGGPLLAQESRGTILGRVTDQSNAVLPGVAIEVTNTGTGVTITVLSNDEGNYVAPFLNPGMYRISFSLPGFNRHVVDKAELRVADQLTLNASLQVGVEAQEVIVTADKAVLESSSASLGQVIDQRRIQELPMREGNPMELVVLAPGVANTTDLRFRKSGMTHSQSQWESDGTGEKRSDFTIDGTPNTSSFGGNSGTTVAYAPPASSVQEFRVQSANYDASIGNTPGAVVNTLMKGGTNEFHGDGIYKYRSHKLDAKNIFYERSGVAKQIYDDNLYGASFGGPIRREQTFFFAAFEGNVYGVPRSTGAQTVPTQKMRDGDFSDLLALGPQYQIYDPATTRPHPTTPGRLVRDPLPGNIIPSSRINPVAQKLVGYFALPNVTGQSDGLQNFQPPNFVEEQTNYTFTTRIDHNLSDRQRLYGRVSLAWWKNIKDDFYGNEANGFRESRDNKIYAIDHIYTFSPNFVMNNRAGYTWQAFPQGSHFHGFDLASVGFDPSVVALYPKDMATFPQLRIGSSSLMRASSSVSGVDGTNGIMDYWTDIWSYSGGVSWLKGAHNLRFGPEVRVYNEHNITAQYAPRLDFDTNYTRGPNDNSTAAPHGQQMASFMMGYLTGGSMRLEPERHEKITRVGLYIHDDWKAARKLTLNLGLRWEYEEPLKERNDAMVNGFDFSTSLPIEAQAQANFAARPPTNMPAGYQYQVHGGILYAGQSGQDNLLHKRLWTSFMPRVGFAYTADSKTVIRGGFGLFFDSTSLARYNVQQPGYTRSTPIIPTRDNGQTFVASLANPFPDGLLQPVGNSFGLMTNVGTNVSFPFIDDVKAPYGQRMSIGVQRQVGDMVVGVSYVGSRMRRIPVTKQLNAIPAEYLSTLPTRDQPTINYLTGQVPNPLFGISDVTAGMTGSTVARSQLLRPYPQFVDISTQESIGKRWYDAAQVSLERRFSRGFTFQTSYTYSETIQQSSYLNQSDSVLEKVIDGADRPHIFVASGIFELPFGRNRAWGTTLHPVLDHVLGGWQAGLFYRVQSGTPMGFGNFMFKEGYSIDDVAKPGSERTEEALFAGLPLTASATKPWFNTEPFVTASNLQRDANHIRTQPSRFKEVRSPGYELFDVSLIKKFFLGETREAQVRIECYNLLNKMNWRGPNTTVTSSSLGTITGISGYPRQIQLALMFRF